MVRTMDASVRPMETMTAETVRVRSGSPLPPPFSLGGMGRELWKGVLWGGFGVKMWSWGT